MKKISNGLFAINPFGECVRVNIFGWAFPFPREGTFSQAFQTDMMDVNMTIITMLGRAPLNEAFHTSQSALQLGYAFTVA